MTENPCMEKKKQIFVMDSRIKDLFNAYCDKRSVFQEKVLEALVFMLVIKNEVSSAERDQILNEVREWKESPETWATRHPSSLDAGAGQIEREPAQDLQHPRDRQPPPSAEERPRRGKRAR